MKKYLFIPIATILLTGCGPKQEVTNTVVPIRFSDGIKFAQGNTNQTFQLTATVEPDYAYNKQIKWSIEWASDDATLEDDDSFKTGKIASDYVSLTVDSNDDNVAYVKFLQPFGSQIVVKAASVYNPSVFAECEVNYSKRMQAYNHLGANFLAANGSTFINPIEFRETMGTKGYSGSKNITYKYGKHFYWQAPQYASGAPAKATEIVNVSHPGYLDGQGVNLFTAMPERLSKITSKEVNFESVSRVLSGPANTNVFLNTLYYAIKNIKSSGTRNGADLYFAYTAYLDGQQYGEYLNNHKTVIEDGVKYGLAKIDISGLDIPEQLTITLTDTEITY